jgi:hypothetical protein
LRLFWCICGALGDDWCAERPSTEIVIKGLAGRDAGVPN